MAKWDFGIRGLGYNMLCRSCGSDVVPILTLGDQPPANSFTKGYEEEKVYPLDLVLCSSCHLFQLSEESEIPKEEMFKKYLYASSTSGSFRKHFENLAKKIADRCSIEGGCLHVVDIGSNDGILLKPLQALGMTATGVEPAENLAKKANEEGVLTFNTFFDENIAQAIETTHGKADVITACNVFAHNADLVSIINGVKELLTDNGTFIIEFQYLSDMFKNMTFDNIYHEHIFYYTLTSLQSMLNRHGLYVVDAERIDTHGGSIRAYVKKVAQSPSEEVLRLIMAEEEQGMDTIYAYLTFAGNVYALRDELMITFQTLKNNNKFVMGYGAPAKSSTLLNFVGDDAKVIKSIIDDSPLKQGLYTPGLHIPVVNSDILKNYKPDYMVVLAWNFASDIIKKVKEQYSYKGNFIIPLPEPRII